MAIPSILRGDTSAAIPFTAPETVARMLCKYQGATRTFENVLQGASLSIRFSAEETARFDLGTFPIIFAVGYADGRVKTYPISAKIKVTDSPALVYGTSVDVDPGADGGKPLDGVDALPELHTMDDMAAKLNEIIHKLGGGVAAILLTLCLSALGASVQTAPLRSIRNDAQVVTNVTFAGLAPADYETVSNRAMSAVQPAEMNAAIAAIPSTDLTPATNYTDAALASATTNLARSVADRYLPLSGGIVRGNLQIGYAADNYAVGQRFVRVDVGGISIDEISEVQYIDVTGVDDQGREIHTMVPIPKAFSTPVWLQLPTNSGHIARTEDILLPVTTAKEEAFDYTDSAITPATNNLRSIEARVDIIEEALDREWNRPGEWELRYSASPISPVLSRFAVVTNDETGVIVSNATVTETQSLAANIYSYPLDELSMSPAPTVTLSCNDAGASLSGSVLTVDTNGVYTVRGTAPDGATRSVQVPMYVTTLTDRHKSTYIADTNGSARAVVNDTMLTALEDAATYEHSTLDYPTDRGANPPGQFTGWRTITPTWAWPGVGNLNPWAIAPKVLVSASHWIRRPPNPIQLYDSVGGTNFFVSVGYWEHLDTWARTNGFTDAESRAADRADICLGGIVEGYVPDACLPYLADAAELDALFGGTIDGVMAWHYPRGTTEDTCGTTEQVGNLYTWCIPVLLNVNGPTADTPICWTGPAYMTDANDTNVRADILALIGKYDANNWWRVRGGDSGRPVFIRWGQYDIPVAETHRTTMGGSIPAAATIIRAFCAQHGCTPKSLPH